MSRRAKEAGFPTSLQHGPVIEAAIALLLTGSAAAQQFLIKHDLAHERFKLANTQVQSSHMQSSKMFQDKMFHRIPSLDDKSKQKRETIKQVTHKYCLYSSDLLHSAV